MERVAAAAASLKPKPLAAGMHSAAAATAAGAAFRRITRRQDGAAAAAPPAARSPSESAPERALADAVTIPIVDTERKDGWPGPHVVATGRRTPPVEPTALPAEEEAAAIAVTLRTMDREESTAAEMFSQVRYTPPVTALRRPPQVPIAPASMARLAEAEKVANSAAAPTETLTEATTKTQRLVPPYHSTAASARIRRDAAVLEQHVAAVSYASRILRSLLSCSAGDWLRAFLLLQRVSCSENRQEQNCLHIARARGCQIAKHGVPPPCKQQVRPMQQTERVVSGLKHRNIAPTKNCDVGEEAMRRVPRLETAGCSVFSDGATTSAGTATDAAATVSTATADMERMRTMKVSDSQSSTAFLESTRPCTSSHCSRREEQGASHAPPLFEFSSDAAAVVDSSTAADTARPAAKHIAGGETFTRRGAAGYGSLASEGYHLLTTGVTTPATESVAAVSRATAGAVETSRSGVACGEEANKATPVGREAVTKMFAINSCASSEAGASAAEKRSGNYMTQKERPQEWPQESPSCFLQCEQEDMPCQNQEKRPILLEGGLPVHALLWRSSRFLWCLSPYQLVLLLRAAEDLGLHTGLSSSSSTTSCSHESSRITRESMQITLRGLSEIYRCNHGFPGLSYYDACVENHETDSSGIFNNSDTCSTSSTHHVMGSHSSHTRMCRSPLNTCGPPQVRIAAATACAAAARHAAAATADERTIKSSVSKHQHHLYRRQQHLLHQQQQVCCQLERSPLSRGKQEHESACFPQQQPWCDWQGEEGSLPRQDKQKCQMNPVQKNTTDRLEQQQLQAAQQREQGSRINKELRKRICDNQQREQVQQSSQQPGEVLHAQHEHHEAEYIHKQDKTFVKQHRQRRELCAVTQRHQPCCCPSQGRHLEQRLYSGEGETQRSFLLILQQQQLQMAPSDWRSEVLGVLLIQLLQQPDALSVKVLCKLAKYLARQRLAAPFLCSAAAAAAAEAATAPQTARATAAAAARAVASASAASMLKTTAPTATAMLPQAADYSGNIAGCDLVPAYTAAAADEYSRLLFPTRVSRRIRRDVLLLMHLLLQSAVRQLTQKAQVRRQRYLRARASAMATDGAEEDVRSIATAADGNSDTAVPGAGTRDVLTPIALHDTAPEEAETVRTLATVEQSKTEAAARGQSSASLPSSSSSSLTGHSDITRISGYRAPAVTAATAGGFQAQSMQLRVGSPAVSRRATLAATGWYSPHVTWFLPCSTYISSFTTSSPFCAAALAAAAEGRIHERDVVPLWEACAKLQLVSLRRQQQQQQQAGQEIHYQRKGKKVEHQHTVYSRLLLLSAPSLLRSRSLLNISKALHAYAKLQLFEWTGRQPAAAYGASSAAAGSPEARLVEQDEAGPRELAATKAAQSQAADAAELVSSQAKEEEEEERTDVGDIRKAEGRKAPCLRQHISKAQEGNAAEEEDGKRVKRLKNRQAVPISPGNTERISYLNREATTDALQQSATTEEVNEESLRADAIIQHVLLLLLQKLAQPHEFELLLFAEQQAAAAQVALGQIITAMLLPSTYPSGPADTVSFCAGSGESRSSTSGDIAAVVYQMRLLREQVLINALEATARHTRWQTGSCSSSNPAVHGGAAAGIGALQDTVETNRETNVALAARREPMVASCGLEVTKALAPASAIAAPAVTSAVAAACKVKISRTAEVDIIRKSSHDEVLPSYGALNTVESAEATGEQKHHMPPGIISTEPEQHATPIFQWQHFVQESNETPQVQQRRRQNQNTQPLHTRRTMHQEQRPEQRRQQDYQFRKQQQVQQPTHDSDFKQEKDNCGEETSRHICATASPTCEQLRAAGSSVRHPEPRFGMMTPFLRRQVQTAAVAVAMEHPFVVAILQQRDEQQQHQRLQLHVQQERQVQQEQQHLHTKTHTHGGDQNLHDQGSLVKMKVWGRQRLDGVLSGDAGSSSRDPNSGGSKHPSTHGRSTAHRYHAGSTPCCSSSTSSRKTHGCDNSDSSSHVCCDAAAPSNSSVESTTSLYDVRTWGTEGTSDGPQPSACAMLRALLYARAADSLAVQQESSQQHGSISSVLSSLGIPHRVEVAAGPYVLDIFLPKMSTCIEVDGPLHFVEDLLIGAPFTPTTAVRRAEPADGLDDSRATGSQQKSSYETGSPARGPATEAVATTTGRGFSALKDVTLERNAPAARASGRAQASLAAGDLQTDGVGNLQCTRVATASVVPGKQKAPLVAERPPAENPRGEASTVVLKERQGSYAFFPPPFPTHKGAVETGIPVGEKSPKEYLWGLRYDAKSKLKHRLLTKCGIRVVHIAWFDWPRYRHNQETAVLQLLQSCTEKATRRAADVPVRPGGPGSLLFETPPLCATTGTEQVEYQGGGEERRNVEDEREEVDTVCGRNPAKSTETPQEPFAFAWRDTNATEAPPSRSTHSRCSGTSDGRQGGSRNTDGYYHCNIAAPISVYRDVAGSGNTAGKGREGGGATSCAAPAVAVITTEAANEKKGPAVEGPATRATAEGGEIDVYMQQFLQLLLMEQSSAAGGSHASGAKFDEEIEEHEEGPEALEESIFECGF